MPWADMCAVQVSITRRPLPRTEDSEGPAAPRSATDSTEQWVWCLMNIIAAVYITCYFCYMLSLGPSSGSTGSVRIYRSADIVQTGGVVRVRYMLFNEHLGGP